MNKGLIKINNIVNQNESSPYQSQLFFSLYYKSQFFRIIGLKPQIPMIGKSYYCIEYYNDENMLICLVPIMYSKKEQGVSFLCDHKSINNFVYNSELFSQKIFDEIIQYIKNTFNCKYIYLPNINVDSMTRAFLENGDYCIEQKSDISVGINIGNSYEEWLDSLSKSARQNLRTAYNRISKDGKKLEVVHFNKGNISRKLVRKLMWIQRYRNLERDNRRYGIFTNGMIWIGSYLSLLNPRVQMLYKSESSFVTIIKIDDEEAAFVGGYKDRLGRFYIPFLKYYSKFKRYSPGGIVINESIKYLKEEVSDFELSFYDLMTGQEKYKYTYGGTEYNNQYYTIMFNN